MPARPQDTPDPANHTYPRGLLVGWQLRRQHGPALELRQFRLSSARPRKRAGTDAKLSEMKRQVSPHGEGVPQVSNEGSTEPGLQANS